MYKKTDEELRERLETYLVDENIDDVVMLFNELSFYRDEDTPFIYYQADLEDCLSYEEWSLTKALYEGIYNNDDFFKFSDGFVYMLNDTLFSFSSLDDDTSLDVDSLIDWIVENRDLCWKELDNLPKCFDWLIEYNEKA